MINQVLCKMTDCTLKMTDCTLKMTDLLMTLNLNSLQHLTVCVAFNKTLRASKGATEAGQMTESVLAKKARGGGHIQANCQSYLKSMVSHI